MRFTKDNDGKSRQPNHIKLGLRPNIQQFLILVLVNAFVGAMIGLEQTVVPLIGKNEFGIEYDTLLIENVNAATDEFAITRRWKYIHHGADTIYKVQRSFAKFKPFEHRLHDAVKGKYYLFDLDAGTISDGEAIYRR